ncbi:DDE-type integrase/transposase/recombinase (plasmid) [Rhodococcus qingshengii]|nr:DDE-type integrase/transposase/recombinase [Rhodococcus qingshengii]
MDRKLTRDEPNKLWLTDIAEYSTPWTQEREGRTYCAVVKATFSRRFVGWSSDSSKAATFDDEFLWEPSSQIGPDPGSLIHSDRGVQFTSWAFIRTRDSRLVVSMGSIGDGYDNALSESLWGRTQNELLNWSASPNGRW